MKLIVNQKQYTLKENYLNVLDCLRSLNIIVEAPCSGLAICGRCVVKINNPTHLSDEDHKHLSSQQLDDGFRLACRYPLYDGLSITIDNSKLHILEKHSDIAICNPFIKSRYIEPGFKNTTSESYEKLLQLKKMSYQILQQIDNHIVNKRAFYLVESSEIMKVSLDKTKVYGCALDIGTTTIVMSFYDLENGKWLLTDSFKNPQSAYGADVISRISNEDDYDQLTSLIQNIVEKHIDHFERKYGPISHLVVAGNTTMTQLFLGLSIKSLGFYPFNFALDQTLTLKLSSFFNNSFGLMTVLPSFSAFVGSDILSGVLALNLSDINNSSLLIDLGTNGELILIHDNKYYGTSTAAGPVFEGVSLECGMQAKAGAVYDIKDELLTIKNHPPIGICGTGALSLLAWLYRNDHIDDTGRLKIGESYDFDQVYLSQGDIRALQTAKSAIRTGIEILMTEAGITSNDITSVYLAGGFSDNINLQALYDIELLPIEFTNKTHCIGNSSLSGAVSYLFDKSSEQKITNILKRATIVSLSEHPDFQGHFMDYMYMKKPAD